MGPPQYLNSWDSVVTVSVRENPSVHAFTDCMLNMCDITYFPERFELLELLLFLFEQFVDERLLALMIAHGLMWTRVFGVRDGFRGDH